MSFIQALRRIMSKKKNTILIVGAILVMLMGFIGKYQYDNYQAEENRKLSEVALVFMVLRPEDKNPVRGSYSDAELQVFLKSPPKIEMNTSSGLGLKVSAYNYYNDADIDAYSIQKMMESGKIIQTYDEYQNFMSWSNKNKNKIADYDKALCYVAEKLGTPLPTKGEDITYLDYLNIINNPETPALIEEYFNED